ncbi:hypothetical protein EYF80_014014 [Liparis tanakae]|uniref:Uncharacterized protein n=1 Tax=Liparis tanakae TaxID=230148 RepID=A0A4Z2ID46_9TELE|nr:hypothetical protein EYF80_014014 [Liparis tanakae]
MFLSNFRDDGWVNSWLTIPTAGWTLSENKPKKPRDQCTEETLQVKLRSLKRWADELRAVPSLQFSGLGCSGSPGPCLL